MGRIGGVGEVDKDILSHQYGRNRIVGSLASRAWIIGQRRMETIFRQGGCMGKMDGESEGRTHVKFTLSPTPVAKTGQSC